VDGRTPEQWLREWIEHEFAPDESPYQAVTSVLDAIERAEAALREVGELPDRVRVRMDTCSQRVDFETGRMVPPTLSLNGEWITVRMASKIFRDELRAILAKYEGGRG
jgi:hypothetical protein